MPDFNIANQPSTLQAIAEHGADAFYTGAFGKLTLHLKTE